VTCNYSNSQLQIGNTVLKLHPFSKLTLEPRSETIIKATTDKNRVGIVRAEEVTPGVYIGNCLVNVEECECPVSVINTTDKTIEIAAPHVTVEEIEPDTSATIHTVQTNKNRKSIRSGKLSIVVTIDCAIVNFINIDNIDNFNIDNFEIKFNKFSNSTLSHNCVLF